ncbi:MAG: hypothetical protein GTO51_08500 [Candidatus Latescibacteria bacterium]|nr:hypothetical protein [Candidatus Latescibacterota bacterium]NIM21993.1 hypothetical protein [Candidatus Latescibacterota bacterium]NIM66011.1 hypothetical protein [Candidatus Latescibacterota bacterium]NIO02419.1 hypothetical protein [Candidatus Latescibacterota bacterium]NIO29330.1 hypothetical protein [Candidatus Latescibacterota bacterium]
MKPFEELSREDLIKLINVYAKNWLAHDGCWFLAVEERYGLEEAIELDANAWHRFAEIEATRIMNAFDIQLGGGLQALEKVLQHRLYAAINRQNVEWVGDKKFIFKMLECKVQQARRRKKLPDFPCKPVGMVEFSRFAWAVDPRIKMTCISCPPDPVGEFFCGWEFTIED